MECEYLDWVIIVTRGHNEMGRAYNDIRIPVCTKKVPHELCLLAISTPKDCSVIKEGRAKFQPIVDGRG